MKKKISIAILILTFILTSCSKSEVETINISDSGQVKTYDYQESDFIAEKVKIDDFEINTQSDGNIRTFCIYDDTMYYTLDFLNYFENSTGLKSDIVFEEKYNTQIRSYNLESGNDILLYQYEEEECIEVTDMQCNGKELVWEDYTKENTWNIKKMTINSDTLPEDIFSYDAEKGKMDSITLSITADSLFWFDQIDNGDKPIILNKYDFKSKKITIEKKGLSLSSPYEHVNLTDGVCTTYETNKDDTTIIHVIDVKNKDQLDISEPGSVSSPISNGEFCVWVKGYDSNDRKTLFIYDITRDTLEQIEIPYAFSYGIIKDLILVNQQDGIYCYDVKNKEYKNLIETENISYGYTFQGLNNNIYAQEHGDDHGVNIINFNINE